MKIDLSVRGGQKSAIRFVKDVFSLLSRKREELLSRGVLVFTDRTVSDLYGESLRRALPGVPCFAAPAGEASKSREVLFDLLAEMARAELLRNSVLIALGGGVVGDVGGLAASLYMRGISCIGIPTTLLAQADASVGGKTAIDFCGVKNLVGTFSSPERVYLDSHFLATLPRREIRSGLGEIVKHGALCPPLFRTLADGRDRLFDLAFLSRILPQNVAFKADVVRRDPFDRGARQCLNLGHTTAHALETGAKGLTHGECVLFGLRVETALARRYGGVDEAFAEQLDELCRTALEGAAPPDFAKAVPLARADKKNRAAGLVSVVAPVAAGEYRRLDLPYEEYRRAVCEIAERLC